MKTVIYLTEDNHNQINLDGTLIKLLMGKEGLTITMIGENNKKLQGLFTEIRKGEKIEKMKGMIEGAVCIVEKDAETLYFPKPIRVSVEVE